MKKIILILVGVLMISLSLVQAENIPSNLHLSTTINPINLVTYTKIIHYECGGCSKGERCYAIGTRWGSEYCNLESKFVPQKIIEESCHNNFECQSGECVAGECEQAEGIEIIEIYNGEDTIVKNLFLQKQGGIFYFQGLNQLHKINFIRIFNGNATPTNIEENSKLYLSINNKLYNLTNEIIYSTPTSQFILEGGGILIEDGIEKINVTFIESKTPFNDSKKLIEELTCNGLFVNETYRNEGEEFEIDGSQYKIENLSLVEIQEEENSNSITGAVVGDKENVKSERTIRKVLNWIKGIFRVKNY